MSTVEAEARPFELGTTGWAADDLDDPAVERLWFQGRYEIISGVLTKLAPAYFGGGLSLFSLVEALSQHGKASGTKLRFAMEADVILDRHRVVRADAIMLLSDDLAAQKAAARKAGRQSINRSRIYIPPTLIIESLSYGHEDHDRETKRQWYAEFGVPYYWLMDSLAQTLECLRLEENEYHADASGKGPQIIRPSLFAGLEIDLKKIWIEDD